MFEVFKYKREYKPLTLPQKNEVLEGILGTVPTNAPIDELIDLDRIIRFWKFDVRLDRNNQRFVFDLYTTAVEMQRQSSETGKLMKHRLKALMSFAEVSPFYRRSVEGRYKSFFESGVYKQYPLSRDTSPVPVIYFSTEDLTTFKDEILLPAQTGNTGMFTAEGGLAVERDAFVAYRHSFLTQEVDSVIKDTNHNTVPRDAKHFKQWLEAFTRHHKQQP